MGKTIARKTNESVIIPLIKAAISAIAVIGFELLLMSGSKTEVNTPRIIVIKYLGYLETFAKNSPIEFQSLFT